MRNVVGRLRARIRQLAESAYARTYARDGFRGSVMTLLSGTAVTLVLSYVAIPILTRLFTPEQFGISDYFVMIVSVLVTLSSLRYDDAMMLPESEEGARSIFWVVLLLTCGSALVLVVAALWSTQIASALRVAEVAPWLWLVAPAILLMRFTKVSEVWLSRHKAFRAITAGEVTNKLTMLSARIGAGAATRLGAGGLIGGFVVGQAASALYYGAVLLRTTESPLRSRPEASSLRAIVRRYRRFPFYSMPSSVLGAVVSRLPILLLPVFFSLEVVGLFGRAYVALAVPLSLIGAAVSQVFFVHAAEAAREGRLSVLAETVHGRLVMIGVFPTLLLVAVGPELFEFVFGPEWRVAGTYERYLAGWFFLSAVASPLTRLFDVLERQRTELLISIVMSLALTLALFVGGRSGNVMLTMALIASAGALVRILQMVTLLQIADVPVLRAARPYLLYGLLSIPLVMVVWMFNASLPVWGTALASFVAGVAYLAVLAFRELR